MIKNRWSTAPEAVNPSTLEAIVSSHCHVCLPQTGVMVQPSLVTLLDLLVPSSVSSFSLLHPVSSCSSLSCRLVSRCSCSCFRESSGCTTVTGSTLCRRPRWKLALKCCQTWVRCYPDTDDLFLSELSSRCIFILASV